MSICVGYAEQDKNEALPYTIDFSRDLDGATIASAVWTASSDLTIENTSFTTTAASVRFSGGTSGKTYKLECTVTGSDGSRHQGHFVVTVLN